MQASLRVESLPIPPRLVAAVEEAGFHTLEHVLHYSEGDIVRRTKLQQKDVRGLVQLSSEALLPAPTFSNALDLYQRGLATPHWGRLSLGCPVLDCALRGGILHLGLTELAGTSGAGKTQLCLQLCLTVQLSAQDGGLSGGAVYVCTEDAFPNKRLHQLVNAFVVKHNHFTPKMITDAIFIEHSATISSMSALLQFKLPALLQQQPSTRLIIIDSMAALFRVEFSSAQLRERAKLLQTFGALLHKIIHQYNVTVVCTNQVTADVGSGVGVKPALGLTWADNLGTRLVLYRDESVTDQTSDTSVATTPVPRQLTVQLAPHLPPLSVLYFIDQTGVHGIADIASPQTY